MAAFEWDGLKAQSNRRKHGVDFADAVPVFEDPRAVTIASDEAADEERLVTIGTGALGWILVVVYAWRDERIRLISARKATPRERGVYLIAQ